MPQEFNMQEALRLAIQTEKDVMDFYNKAAALTKNERGRKVFLALNTFPQTTQWHLWRQAVDDAAELGVDALILADAGLMRYASRTYPNLRLHLSVQEQLSIDQPPGIAAAYGTMAARAGEHDAQHAVMECLAETLWRAQRDRMPPDGAAYLQCLQQKAGA